MNCAISGEAPQVPVVSRKSGIVYEKRLIEAYVLENGTEPTTGESLSTEDLLDIRKTQSIRPRPPTLTSIPALLSVFQEEWDALALETYTLQQNLAQTRQELSTVLYHQDAAVRVIAKLTRERDEAREALAKINVGARTNGANGDEMQIDNAPLPEKVVAKIDSTQERLSSTRRKRPVPEEWATADQISKYQPASTSEPLYPGAKFLAVDESGDSVLLGGTDGAAGIYSVSQNRVVHTLKSGDGSITCGVWSQGRAVISSSAGTVKVFQGQDEISTFKTHSASVTGLSIHPSGDVLASVSNDKSYTLYDLESSKVLTQVFTDSEISCTQFHPDGHLLAIGGADGQIKFYDIKSGSLGGSFDTGSPVKSIFFSENGTWVAAANSNSSIVSIWDLRKAGTSSKPVKTIETGGVVESLHWDYTAQYLLVGGPAGVSVEQYTKATKEWSEILKLGVPASAVSWGASAKAIVSVNMDGALSILS